MDLPGVLAKGARCAQYHGNSLHMFALSDLHCIRIIYMCAQRHMQNMKKGRCRLNTVVPMIEDIDPPVITAPVAHPEPNRVEIDFVGDIDPPVITAPVAHPEPPPEPNHVEIARRWPHGIQWSALVTTMREVAQRDSPVLTRARDISRIQLAWRRYLDNVVQLCSPSFWKFFLPMHSLSRKAVDTALQSAHNTFLDVRTQSFPQSTRTLFSKIAKVEPFWHQVMHSVHIDLSKFDLPENKRRLTFEFVDPLWAWVSAAYKQPPLEMQWIPKVQTLHGQRCYGGGLQFGEAFAEAYRTCPAGTYPMCISLHWDGSHAHGLHATPICIGVGNTNSMSAETQYCVGYIPVLSDLGDHFESKATEIKFYIRNKSIGAILQVLEVASRSGVRCRLPSSTGEEQEMILMPRLFAMNLDQPEAQLYFGLQNRT